MSKISDIEFANRQLDPSWNARADMAKKIRDFLDVPTHGPLFKRRLTEYEKIAEHYQQQLQGLRCHLNAMVVLELIQTGRVP